MNENSPGVRVRDGSSGRFGGSVSFMGIFDKNDISVRFAEELKRIGRVV